MDEVSRYLPVVVRAAVPGEGIAIASLWRELWEASEAWGGYPASHDCRTYAELGQRIDASLGLRTGQTVSSRDIHLVADIGGLPCGQVEGVVDRHGADPATPFSCDVRSLIVTRAARGKGAGRALLGALANAAMTVTGSAQCVLTAEVLESNPALAFYEREGTRSLVIAHASKPRGARRYAANQPDTLVPGSRFHRTPSRWPVSMGCLRRASEQPVTSA